LAVFQGGPSRTGGKAPISESYGSNGIAVDLRCPVTLKVISEKYLEDESARLRFLREARAAASLRHSNVASVLYLGRSGCSYFYAMEFVEGETLKCLGALLDARICQVPSNLQESA
jgi:serine/threonine protein kinase